VRRRPWLANVFTPLVLSTMMGCIALAIVNLGGLFSPEWNGTYVVAGCALAALEASYSHRLIRARDMRGRDLSRFRLAEIAAILILLKIGSYIGRSWADIRVEIGAWPARPLTLLNIETLVASVLVMWCWLTSTMTTRDLERIDDPLDHSRHGIPPKQAILDRIFGGGILLFIVTGITRVGLAVLFDLDRASVPGILISVLVYFLLGLVLMGQVRYLSLDKQWHSRQIRVSSKLSKNWARYSLGFLVLVAVIAFLLPTSYTLGLLDVAARVLAALSYVARLAAELMLFLVMFPIWLILSLFSPGQVPPARPQIGAVEPPAITPVSDPTGGPGWLEVLRSLVFWAVALGAVAYVLRTYLRDRPEIVRSLLTFGPIRFAYSILLALWRRLTRTAAAINERLPRDLFRRRRAGRASSRHLGRFFRLGALSPRERTLYYYLSILRRAGQAGLPRRPWQTPYEYDDSIRPHLDQAQQEMDMLTDDFVSARYSPHPIDRERESQVRARWKRVRDAVRALGKRHHPQEQDG
jgi:hypothetical protein